MDLLYYNDLNYKKAGTQFDRVAEQLAQADFRFAEVKKMPDSGYFMARLDDENRLLFKIARHSGKKYLLLPEVIYNHDYSKSRFLRSAKIDETKCLELPSPDVVEDNEIVELSYVNPTVAKFHLLDKFISFDEFQEDVFSVKPPVIIIGSAGRLKVLQGNEMDQRAFKQMLQTRSHFYGIKDVSNFLRSSVAC